MEKDSAEELHSLSLSHSHTYVHTYLCSATAVLISGQRYTGTKINVAVQWREWGCSQLKLLVWDWKGWGRGVSTVGRPGKARAEPRQEADGLSHMAVRISPVNFTSQFLHPSIAHVYHRGHSVLKVGRSDWFIHWQAFNDTYHVPGIFWKTE